jgi:magnesium transporter
VIVDCAWYADGVRKETLPLQDVSECRGKGGFIWIGLFEPTEEEFTEVGEEFGLHELAVEDAVRAHQRPKLEVYDDSLFLVLKTARYLDATETVEFGEMQIFVGEDHLVVVRHGQPSELTGVRKSLEEKPELLAQGPSVALHAIVDRVVDGYFPVLDGLDNDISEVEEEVFSEVAHNPVQRIYMLKREVLGMHRAALPLLTPMETLADRKVPMLHESVGEYFRNVHDHLLRVKDQIETFNDLLSSVLEANLTRVQVKQNDDMRRMAAYAAIFAASTVIAGIYGMNFDHMPELGWGFGYPFALGLMVAVSGGLVAYFRRKGWL